VFPLMMLAGAASHASSRLYVKQESYKEVAGTGIRCWR